MTRLANPYMTPIKLKGLWRRDQRMYFLHSLACQPNADRQRAQEIIRQLNGRWDNDSEGQGDE